MPLIYYILFISISLPSVIIFGEILLIEITAIFVIFTAYFLESKPFKIMHIDKVIFIFMMLGLLSVAMSDDLYSAFRYYRHNYLTPYIVYLSIRLINPGSSNAIRLMHLLIPVTLFQSVLLINAYYKYGGRQQFFEGSLTYTITLASLLVICIAILIFNYKSLASHVVKLISFVTIIILLAGLYYSFSRTSLFALIAMTPMAGILLKNTFRVTASYRLIFGSLVIMLGIIFGGVIQYKDSGLDKDTQKSLQHSSGRLTSVKLLIQDTTARFNMWSYDVKKGMERPILGGGGTGYERVQGDSVIKSSHNYFVTLFLESGFLGLLFFLYIVFILLKMFVFFAGSEKDDLILSKILSVTLISLLLVGITGGFSGGRLVVFFAVIGLVVNHANNIKPIKSYE